MAKQFKPGRVFGRWRLQKFIASGGNGEVWAALADNEEQHAIKLLRKPEGKAYQRFHDEIRILLDNPDFPGVLPIIDYYLPDEPSGDLPWYVMPIAVPIQDYLYSASEKEVVDAFVSLAQALDKLHNRGVFHRDIKPANLYWYDELPCFGDFGLADFLDKEDVTSSKEIVGARWTRAPEMERAARTSSGGPADVYSLAKSLWIILTGEPTGFEGQYSAESEIALRSYRDVGFSEPLDRLLQLATAHDPDRRPTAHEFAQGLRAWLRIKAEFHEYNPMQWKRALHSIFPTTLPKRAVWEDLESICLILSILGEHDSTNHMFYPDGGGMDLRSASFGAEPNTIELVTDGTPVIVKPNRLMFESFGVEMEWNYFRLETSELSPIHSDDVGEGEIREMLTEVAPGYYTIPNEWIDDTVQDESFAESGRPVVRYLQGSFVIFQKVSTYNFNSGTYDGRHNLVDADQFRAYIQQQVYLLSVPPVDG